MSGSHHKNEMRIRACGLLKKGDKVLMEQLKSPLTDELVWMLPGGGLQFGEKIKEGLEREFREETGLQIAADQFIAANEVIHFPFHAIEFYFKVEQIAGKLQLGCDPEYGPDEQIIQDLQWISTDQFEEINIVPEQVKQWSQGANFGRNPGFYSQSI